MSQQLELLTTNGYDQLTRLNKIFPEIQIKELKGFLILALKDLQGEPDELTSSLAEYDKYSSIHSLLKHVARLKSSTGGKWNETDIKAFLQGLKFSNECVPELCRILCNDDIYATIPQHLNIEPNIMEINWKIDLSLCQSTRNQEKITSNLNNFISIILSFELSNGKTVAKRFSIAQFHSLRHTVANLLKNIIILEKRRCIKRVK